MMLSGESVTTSASGRTSMITVVIDPSSVASRLDARTPSPCGIGRAAFRSRSKDGLAD